MRAAKGRRSGQCQRVARGEAEKILKDFSFDLRAVRPLMPCLADDAASGRWLGLQASERDQVAAVATVVREALGVLADMADAELFEPFLLCLGLIGGIHGAA